jgi:hypothetical protein
MLLSNLVIPSSELFIARRRFVTISFSQFYFLTKHLSEFDIQISKR